MAQEEVHRAGPGSKGEGEFYRIVLRPKNRFVKFRVHDVGKEGHSERLAGQTKSGEWKTQAWLISKEDAHVEGNKLVADRKKTKEILDRLSTKPKRV